MSALELIPPSTIKSPLALISPVTDNFFVGVSFPIPKFPELIYEFAFPAILLMTLLFL